MVKAFNREFDGKAWTEYKGLSNDPRPLSPKAGDVFIETDTLDVYGFNGSAWVQVYPYIVSAASIPNGGIEPGTGTVDIGGKDSR